MLITLVALTISSALGAPQVDDKQLRAEIQLRESIAFRSDAAYIQAVHAAPGAVKIKRVNATFTPAEAREVGVRLDLEKDASTLQDFFVAQPDFQAAFGGLYVDRMTGGNLVLQLVRSHVRTVELPALLPRLLHRERLRVDLVDWSNNHLTQQFEPLSNVMAQHPTLQSVMLDRRNNSVVATVSSTSTGTPAGVEVAKNNLPADLAIVLSDPAIRVVAGEVMDMPSAVMAGYGWGTNGSSNYCTLAFEVIRAGLPSMLSAGHCVSGLANGTKVYHFSLHIGAYSGVSQDGKTSNDGIAIDVAVHTMSNAATATDDIFIGGGRASLDVTGPVEQFSYEPGFIRCFYGISSGEVCSAITNGSYSYLSGHNGRYYRDMFLTDGTTNGGDSGGPIYRANSSTTASAAGIVRGGIQKADGTYDGVHSKWKNAADLFGRTLVTTD